MRDGLLRLRAASIWWLFTSVGSLELAVPNAHRCHPGQTVVKGEVGKSWELLYTPGDHDGHLEPGIFVISPDGVQRTGSYATGPFGRVSVEHVLMQTGMMAKAMAGTG